MVSRTSVTSGGVLRPADAMRRAQSDSVERSMPVMSRSWVRFSLHLADSACAIAVSRVNCVGVMCLTLSFKASLNNWCTICAARWILNISDGFHSKDVDARASVGAAVVAGEAFPAAAGVLAGFGDFGLLAGADTLADLAFTGAFFAVLTLAPGLVLGLVLVLDDMSVNSWLILVVWSVEIVSYGKVCQPSVNRGSFFTYSIRVFNPLYGSSDVR